MYQHEMAGKCGICCGWTTDSHWLLAEINDKGGTGGDGGVIGEGDGGSSEGIGSGEAC